MKHKIMFLGDSSLPSWPGSLFCQQNFHFRCPPTPLSPNAICLNWYYCAGQSQCPEQCRQLILPSGGGQNKVDTSGCYFFFFCLPCGACRILVPWPTTEPTPPASGAWNPNHWTTRHVPWILHDTAFCRAKQGTEILLNNSYFCFLSFPTFFAKKSWGRGRIKIEPGLLWGLSILLVV